MEFSVCEVYMGYKWVVKETGQI